MARHMRNLKAIAIFSGASRNGQYHSISIALVATLIVYLTTSQPIHAQENFHLSLGKYNAKLVESVSDGGLIVAGDDTLPHSDVASATTPFLIRLDSKGNVLWRQEPALLKRHNIRAMTKVDSGFAVLSDSFSRDPQNLGKYRVFLWKLDNDGHIQRLLYEVSEEQAFNTFMRSPGLSFIPPDLILFTSRHRSEGTHRVRAVNLDGKLSWSRSIQPHSLAALADGTIGMIDSSRPPEIVLLNGVNGEPISRFTLPAFSSRMSKKYRLMPSESGRDFQVFFESYHRPTSASQLSRPQLLQPTLEWVRVRADGEVRHTLSSNGDDRDSWNSRNSHGFTFGESRIASLHRNDYGYQLKHFDLSGDPLGSHPVLSVLDRTTGASLHPLPDNRVAVIGTTEELKGTYRTYRRSQAGFINVYSMNDRLPKVPDDCVVDFEVLKSLKDSVLRDFNILVERKVMSETRQNNMAFGKLLAEPVSCGQPPLPAFQEFVVDLKKSLEAEYTKRLNHQLVLFVAQGNSGIREVGGSSVKDPRFAAGVNSIGASLTFLHRELIPAAERIAEIGATFPGTQVKFGHQYTRVNPPIDSVSAPSAQRFIDYAKAYEGLVDEYQTLSATRQSEFHDALKSYGSLEYSTGTGVFEVTTSRNIVFSSDQVKSIIPFVLKEAVEKDKEAALKIRQRELGLNLSIHNVGSSIKRQELRKQIESGFEALSERSKKRFLELGLKLTVQSRHGRQPYGRDGLHIRVAPSHAPQIMEFISNDVLYCYRNDVPLRPSRQRDVQEQWSKLGDFQIRRARTSDSQWELEAKTGNSIQSISGLQTSNPLRFQYETKSKTLLVTEQHYGTQSRAWVVDLANASAASVSEELILNHNLWDPASGVGYTFELENLAPDGTRAALKLSRTPVRVPPGEKSSPAAHRAPSPKRLWIAVDTKSGKLMEALRLRPQCDWWAGKPTKVASN